MKIVSVTGGGWYHADFVPDGSNTFDITAASLRANIVGGPEGIAFVPPGSPVFPSNSVLIALYGLGKVVTAPLDANGDPIVGTRCQDFIRDSVVVDGACIDPVSWRLPVFRHVGWSLTRSYASAACNSADTRTDAKRRRALQGRGLS